MFSTVLIANRGEIALRIARTCRELGIRTVAVYSTADRETPAVDFCDEAVHIGPPPPRASYLYIPAIIEAALRTGAEAIHPGYGFLSEDPEFAAICAEHGVTFVGPPPAVMTQLAEKATARTLMAEAGLPVLPGSSHTVDSETEAKEIAACIGYPVILKAAAGGGGRGMCVVHDGRDLLRAYRKTRAHAHAVFRDGRLYIERYLQSARHIEVQILADGHGNVLHLGERDCSVQRRHQKLLEETPAAGLGDGLADSICEAAVQGAKALGYEGAGTLEFLVDDDNRFYFMEINCRLQVEHPVTEMVTGLDIVGQQLMVANGDRLRLTQDSIIRRGAAVECRVNAEDPDRGFIPTPGVVEDFAVPHGPFTRVDTYGRGRFRVAPEYDPMIAKVITWGTDRETALARMERALGEIRVVGPRIRTTVPFLADVLAQPLYRDGKHTTSLVAQMINQAGGPTAADGAA